MVLGVFEIYVIRFVLFFFGFVLGWNYWFNWVIMVVVELVVVFIVMVYWWFGVLVWMWLVGFLVLFFFLNVLFVCVYGESEFWFVIIKVMVVIVFLVFGIFMIVGVMGIFFGLFYWCCGDVFFVYGFGGILIVFFIVGFFF